MQDLKLGIQLYTVRDAIGEDFKGTLTELSKMGYQGVEFAGNFGGMSSSELSEFFKTLGMEACGCHSNMDNLSNAESDIYRYAEALNIPFLSTSLLGEVEDNWKETVKQVYTLGEFINSKGMTFTYHNHAEEFQMIEGQYALDYLYENTNPDYVKAELDTYWIKKGGPDPAEYIAKYADRTPQIHLKDMCRDTGTFIELGAGIIDFEAIFKIARSGVTEWMIYEQDSCEGPAIQSAEKSIAYLKTLM